MKKIMLLTAIAVFTFATGNAQDGVSFGAKAGVNLASIGGDDVDGLDGRTSLHLGGVVEIPVSDRFSVQGEVLYSAQGATDSEEGVDVTLKLD